MLIQVIFSQVKNNATASNDQLVRFEVELTLLYKEVKGSSSCSHMTVHSTPAKTNLIYLTVRIPTSVIENQHIRS